MVTTYLSIRITPDLIMTMPGRPLYSTDVPTWVGLHCSGIDGPPRLYISSARRQAGVANYFLRIKQAAAVTDIDLQVAALQVGIALKLLAAER